jgi:ABC-type phosphate transport system substrate-binding protein
MTVTNETLKKRFEEKFTGTKVDLASSGTDEALKALLKGDISVAAVGRPLTAQEKAQGLVETPLSREKIAIIVGSNNPFKGNLTFEQFAKIFRGEITDWSQVGGTPGRIRFIDRPESSDTRQSLSRYKVFKAKPFTNGATTTHVSQDDTATVIKELNKDGIGYAIISQVLNQDNVRIIPMHKTLPTDPRYPYSQPRGYVYKQGTSDPAVLAFLGFATSKPGQEVIQLAKKTETETSPTAAVSSVPQTAPDTTTSGPTTSINTALVPGTGAATNAATDEVNRGFPWWLLWLLAIPLLGALLWWLFRGRREESKPIPAVTSPEEAPTTAPTIPGFVPEAVTSTEDPPTEIPTIPGFIPEAITSTEDPPTEIPTIPGFIPEAVTPTEDPPTEIPTIPGFIPEAVTPTEDPPTEIPIIPGVIAGAGIAAAGIAIGGAERFYNSRVVLTPRNHQQAYVHWEVAEEHKAYLQQQGGQKLGLRLYDVTDVDIEQQQPHSVKQFDIEETEPDLYVPIEVDNRDYVAELGYITEDNRWLKIARSQPVRIPERPSTNNLLNADEAVLATNTNSVAGEDTVKDTTEPIIGAVTGGAALGNGAVANQSVVSSDSSGDTLSDRVTASITQGNCAIQHLTVHSQKNCYLLNVEQMQQIEDHTSSAKTLEPGAYIVRIKDGVFGYRSGTELKGEPFVLLWIHGGRFINLKTNVPVNATWSVLNGYDETLSLEVLETAKLHAFFFDTYLEDNATEVTVSIIQFPRS